MRTRNHTLLCCTLITPKSCRIIPRPVPPAVKLTTISAFLPTVHETLSSCYITAIREANKFFRKTHGKMSCRVSDRSRLWARSRSRDLFGLLKTRILRDVINHVDDYGGRDNLDSRTPARIPPIAEKVSKL